MNILRPFTALKPATVSCAMALIACMAFCAPQARAKNATKAPARHITPTEAFIRLPQQYMNILTTSMKRDMVDYLEADSLVPMRNVFLGTSRIEEADSSYMRVKLTDVSTLQIKILPVAKGKLGEVAMTIYTVGADDDTADSTVKFFDGDMAELDASKFLPEFKAEDYLDLRNKDGKRLDRRERDTIIAMLPFYTTVWNASSASADLIGTPTQINYLSQEDREKTEPYIPSSITLVWDGSRYRRNH